MIGLRFEGQLGNQMFQYAAARVQAERLGCRLVIDSQSGLKAAAVKMFRPLPDHRIFSMFPQLKVHPLTRLMPVLNRWPCIGKAARALLFPNRFKPRSASHDDRNEIYDPGIWQIKRGTWLEGYFQSESYFFDQEDKVKGWFVPNEKTAAAVAKVTATLPAPPDKMVAVHVRLTDYLHQKDSFGDPARGWALPKCFYDDAFRQIPDDDAPIALFSDDVTVAESLLPRRPHWVSSNNTADVDLFTMMRFRTLIISNSTFAWWAGWLNSVQDKTIIGPKYFLGRRIGQWYPHGIKVNSWVYV